MNVHIRRRDATGRRKYERTSNQPPLHISADIIAVGSGENVYGAPYKWYMVKNLHLEGLHPEEEERYSRLESFRLRGECVAVMDRIRKKFQHVLDGYIWFDLSERGEVLLTEDCHPDELLPYYDIRDELGRTPFKMVAGALAGKYARSCLRYFSDLVGVSPETSPETAEEVAMWDQLAFQPMYSVLENLIREHRERKSGTPKHQALGKVLSCFKNRQVQEYTLKEIRGKAKRQLKLLI